MDALFQISYDLIEWLQTFSPSFDAIIIGITFLGRFEFYMLFIPLIYYTIDRSLGLRILFLVISVNSLGSSFKQLFHQPRPYWMGEVKGITTEVSYGAPSIHASNTIALWGYLANQVRKSWMWVVSFVIVILVALSRLYLGVHYLHDVISGWILGLIVLFVFIKVEDSFRDWWSKKSFNTQIAFGFLISLALILIGVLIKLFIQGSPDPQEWASYSQEARSVTIYFTLGGVLFGGIAGAVFMFRYAAFEVNGVWWMKVARFVIGIVGVVIIYFGLDVLFALIAIDESLIGYILRYIRYGLVSFWGIFLAPWLFIKIGLAKVSK